MAEPQASIRAATEAEKAFDAERQLERELRHTAASEAKGDAVRSRRREARRSAAGRRDSGRPARGDRRRLQAGLAHR